ncbi:N-acetylglucosamine-6-phosphate deacetylase [Jeotgalibacillus haloalkalitolerans]|uniref:N-acetylglucosamine-6-phosphate deacetylase n=1 Tax=Jeotgalibacillus haloalkalitolerans TaxID=3104292 RepID=A0ABU5KHI5_9BACL|nr:N-acetylglucosamine-6-phosphate deacetylase [Jeotgalibacillus sp. HH7-29]MDZ5710690.1 N-acetylglucosamine-6-phosphate deacetylase [Jeotgalibacillus sp. HH7-29]
MDQYILEQIRIPFENGDQTIADVWVQNGKFKSISSNLSEPDIPRMKVSEKWRILPGFIDIHIHGAGGADVMDSTPEALLKIADTLPSEGTTSFLATTMTQRPEAVNAAVLNAAQYYQQQKAQGQSELLGIHLEGPFISTEKAGAQPLEFIIPPSVELFNKWCEASNDLIRVVTLAPETDEGLSFVKELQTRNIIVSLGHSNASEEVVLKAIEAGASHVTHLYNQMSSFQHREPGMVGIALTNQQLHAELIADFIHSHQSAVQLAIRSKGIDHVILITDAMRAKGLKDGVYELGGQKVTVKGMEARLADGTLAGSVLTMDQAFRHVKKLLGLKDSEMIALTSANAARTLGIFDHKGSITEGKDADFVLLDENDCVQKTACKGIMRGEKL